jgi:hypothetical protein
MDVNDLLGNVRRIGPITENMLYFGRAEENNGNEVQNKLRADNGNLGFPDPCWRCSVISPPHGATAPSADPSSRAV